MGHSLEQSLEYVKLDAPKDNIELKIEEMPEEVIKKKRGRPKKVVEPQVE
jgi:hypothetical protein